MVSNAEYFFVAVLLLLLNFLLHRLAPEFGVYFVAGCDEVWLHLG